MFYKNGLARQSVSGPRVEHYGYAPSIALRAPFIQPIALNESRLLQEIHQLEEQLHGLQPAIFVLNDSHQVIYWNIACKKLTGMDEIHVIGTMGHQIAFKPEKRLQLADVVLANDLSLMRQHFPNVSSSSLLPMGYRHQRQYVDLKGKRCYFNVHAAAIRDITGNQIGVVEVWLPRPKNQTDERRHSIHRFLKKWLPTMPGLAIQSFTPTGEIQIWNQASSALFHFSREQARGRRFQDLILTPDDAIIFENHLRQIHQTCQPTTPIMLHAKTAESIEKHLMLVLSPIVQDRTCHEIMGLCLDCSPSPIQMDTSAELKYHELFQNSTDLLATVDLQGNIFSVNPPFAQLFGHSVEKLCHMKLNELIPSQELDDLWPKLKNVIRKRNGGPVDYVWQRENRARRYLQLNLRLLNKSNHHRLLLIIGHDITEQRKLEHKLHESYRQVIHTLVNFIHIKDVSTGEHSKRLVKDCLYLAQQFQLTHRQVKDLGVAAILHDIGKIKIPKCILTKFGGLTEKERAILHTHPEEGARAVEKIPRFSRICKIIRHHHERFNGSGYPDGLAGAAIPIEARILSVVDAFDAMMSDRPYRQSLGMVKAFSELREGKGKQFDPGIVDIYIEFIKHKHHVDDYGVPVNGREESEQRV
ncbi:PAS domain S-box protein [candidate division KSB1 bacterium]|nr:PAS domain S-box protein [candidate division KSB1 bacterium]